MKVTLTKRQLHLIRLWALSCEDMQIPEGTCKVCEFKEECKIIRKILSIEGLEEEIEGLANKILEYRKLSTGTW